MTALATLTRAALVAGALAMTGHAGAAYYNEAGDAGDEFASQRVAPAGTWFNGIAGTIGDTDETDAFAFWFGGGDLYAQTKVQVSQDFTQFLLAALWTAQPPDPIQPSDPMLPSDPMTPNLANDIAAGLVGFANLAAGNYIIAINVNNTFDPPFTIDLTGPNTAPAQITAPRAVPEPGSLALALLGLGGVLAARRRNA
jgi:hypothetical protein